MSFQLVSTDLTVDLGTETFEMKQNLALASTSDWFCLKVANPAPTGDDIVC